MIFEVSIGIALAIPAALPELAHRRLAFPVGAAGGSGSREVCTAQSWYALLAS